MGKEIQTNAFDIGDFLALNDKLMKYIIEYGSVAIDDMQMEKYIKTVFEKEELTITYYPSSGRFGMKIPKRFRREGLPEKITGHSRDEVISKTFNALVKKHNPVQAKVTLTDLYKDFITNRKSDLDIAAHTVRKNESDWHTFFQDSTIVTVPVDSIRPSDLMEHFKKMTEGRKMTRHAFGNAKGLINQLFDLAYERNLIERNICRELTTKKLKFKPEACKQDLIYTSEERNMICDELEGSDCVYDRAIIMQFCLGCRISEVKGLYWSDVDFDRKEVTIHRELVDDEDGGPVINNYTKNGMTEGNRVLPLSPRAERMLSQIPKPENKESLIFVRDYKPIRTQTVNDHLRNVCRKLGIRYLSTHKIRAWAITESLAAGMDQVSVMRIAGHASPHTMKHYVRVSRIKKDISEKFGEVFS